MNNSITIILADDHSIVREGIRLLLKNKPEIKILGEASNGFEALQSVKQLKPRVLITDIQMPDMTGIEISKKLKSLRIPTRVLVLSMFYDEATILSAVEAGVMGYLPKEAHYSEIVKATKALSEGKTYYNAEITSIITNSIVRKYQVKNELAKLQKLTRREKEILENIVKGRSNKLIAKQLFISTRTVDTHRTNIMKKLQTHNTADLVRKAILNNLI